MKIYENQIIGNFLFTLGYIICAKSHNSSFAANINLLQQTPADKLLGDVMANLGNKVYLIEFKEASNNSTKESDRHRKLSVFLNTKEELKCFIPISKKIHWFIETSVTNGDLKKRTLVSRVAPYLDMENLPNPDPNALNNLIEKIAMDVINPQRDYTVEEAERYLNLVRAALGEGGKCGTGGLLLAANPEGEFKYVVMEDLFDLKRTYKNWELSLQKEWQNEKDLEKDRELKRERKLERDGPSFGR